jgi:hypothetical protein
MITKSAMFNPDFAFNSHDRKAVTTKDENIVAEGS